MSKFLEVTASDDVKMIVNVDHIAVIFPRTNTIVIGGVHAGGHGLLELKPEDITRIREVVNYHE